LVLSSALRASTSDLRLAAISAMLLVMMDPAASWKANAPYDSVGNNLNNSYAEIGLYF
jgi:hypothetical protein